MIPATKEELKQQKDIIEARLAAHKLMEEIDNKYVADPDPCGKQHAFLSEFSSLIRQKYPAVFQKE